VPIESTSIQRLCKSISCMVKRMY